MTLQCAPDLVENHWIIDRRRHRPRVAVGDFLDRAAQDFPERVFGRRATVMASLNAATGPIFSRTSATISVSISDGGRLTPALSTMKPHGTSPLRSSLMPSTAHSATSGWPASTSSMPPVESLWPATLMMSSVRLIT